MTPIRRTLTVFAIGAVLLPSPVAPSTPAGVGRLVESRQAVTLADPAYGTYAWPVQGPVIRGFEPPPDPYSSGHRGIDIGAPFGSDMVAAQDGTVAFAGWVGGSLYISIDNADGVRTTYSWLSAMSVQQGDTVVRGQSIGSTGQGHPGSSTPHLHFGALVGNTYIDPMLLLQPGEVAGIIHLAPLWGGAT
jgi:murein DD-endopeptidase MepM/ murein hydrolase activator NlpD